MRQPFPWPAATWVRLLLRSHEASVADRSVQAYFFCRYSALALIIVTITGIGSRDCLVSYVLSPAQAKLRLVWQTAIRVAYVRTVVSHSARHLTLHAGSQLWHCLLIHYPHCSAVVCRLVQRPTRRSVGDIGHGFGSRFRDLL